MWRHDSQRSASTTNRVPANWELLWTRTFSARRQAWDDPLNLDLMTYDRVFEPIVLNGLLYLGFNDCDKLLALDASTGEDRWSFFADAPVRLPPAGWEDRIFFCSDDGYLYCVRASNGELIWKFAGAPNGQQALGNRRLTSAWPARGGPVVRDGTVYFAASIWPFMGTFLYALDGDNGKLEWVNDSTGSQYTRQPHSAPSFAGVAPQGAIVATSDRLIVPGGRSVPAVFHRRDGKLLYFEINAGGKGTGGSFVAADDDHFYVHTREKGTRAFELSTGIKTSFVPNEPVISGETIYSGEKDDQGSPVIRAYNDKQEKLWEIQADGSGDLIRAGKQLFAAGKSSLISIDLPQGKSEPKIAKKISIDGQIERLLAADDKLFAVTLDGRIMAFGRGAASMPASAAVPSTIIPLQGSSKAQQSFVEELLKASPAEGYAFWLGRADSPLLEALASSSPFEQLVVVDSDQQRVASFRAKLDHAGLYGRVTAHHSPLGEFRPPQCVAHHLFISPEITKLSDGRLIQGWYEAVRPYGGSMHLLSESDIDSVAAWAKQLELEKAVIETRPHEVLVRRDGALPGAANWTHQYGDVANTLKSNDRRVKLPLGVLWFGGSSNLDVLPRHGHGPPEQVVNGRLFIQGMNSLSARDVYTGRVLWKREFENLGTFDVYFDGTYEDAPLNPKYNQVHIPGANGRGTNYVVTDDIVYLLEGSVCHLLDAVTGETLKDIAMPADESGESPEWGYIGVYQDVLIGGQGFAKYRERMQLSFGEDEKLSKSKKGFGSKSLDRAASNGLIGFDRHSGKVLWRLKPNHSFWHNGIVAGNNKVFCLDKNPSQVEEAMKRRGLDLPDTYRIVALDYRSGAIEWEIAKGVFGTWLGFSEEHDLLLQASAKASDRLTSESGKGMAVYRGRDGVVQWKNEELSYAGPCILHNDLIITNVNSYSVSAGAYYLKSGKPKLITNPLSGEEQPWTLTRAYGCNNIIASENLLTFRSGSASFCDLLSDAGTGNLGGFKSGCTSNLVVANGVLNAPDYTRTCSCSYQNQTSLALIPMPDVEVWSVDSMATVTPVDTRFQELAVNFGAPGDRRDSQGRLWIEYPVTSGDAPGIPISVDPQARTFQYHSSRMNGLDAPWILASGYEGITRLQIGLITGSMIKSPVTGTGGDSDDEDASEKPRKGSSSSEKAKPEKAKSTKEWPAAKYDLRLYFALPPPLSGTRVFDVMIQGKVALRDVRLEPESSSMPPQAVLEINGVLLKSELEIEFVPKEGLPVINGITIDRSVDAQEDR